MHISKPLIAALLLALSGALPATAGGDFERTIKHRQNVMNAVGGHMGALSEIVRGRVPFADHAGVHAAAIASTMALTAAMFPPDSAVGETRAKSEIWERWEEFTGMSGDSVELAERLVALIGEGGFEGGVASREVSATLGELAKSCKSCHKAFRTSRRD